jgi:AAA domain
MNSIVSSNSSRRASDIQPRLQRFLWDGLLPEGHITVVAGEPDKGKSLLGYRVAADVAVPTIFITREEVDHSIWRPRLEASGVDPSLAFHHGEIKFGKEHEDRLADLVARYEAKLVVVDPLQWHLTCSINRDQTVRTVLDPFVQMAQDLGFSFLFEVHVLRDIARNAHPLLAVPAGVVSLAKAIYLFGLHPGVGADRNLRACACAKFNFGVHPASRLFEIATKEGRVYDPKTQRWVKNQYAYLEPRGEVALTARALLVKMRPEDRERKSDRVAHHLVQWLRNGPVVVSDIRQEAAALDPPVSWRTVERIAEEMGIRKEKDETDGRRLTWALSEDHLATLEEAGDDPIEIEEIQIPDTLPPEWNEES